MFNSISLPTEKIDFDWDGSGPYRSDIINLNLQSQELREKNLSGHD